MGVLLDSSFLIDLMRSQPRATQLLARLENAKELLLLTSPVVYELLSGLRHKGSRADLIKVETLLRDYPSVDFDFAAARRAAEVRAEIHRTGRPVGVVDVMLAGIALAHGHGVVSRDEGLAELAPLFGFKVIAY